MSEILFYLFFLYGAQPFNSGKPCCMVSLVVFVLSLNVCERSLLDPAIGVPALKSIAE
jgi:hypothetical protein